MKYANLESNQQSKREEIRTIKSRKVNFYRVLFANIE